MRTSNRFIVWAPKTIGVTAARLSCRHNVFPWLWLCGISGAAMGGAWVALAGLISGPNQVAPNSSFDQFGRVAELGEQSDAAKTSLQKKWKSRSKRPK